MSCFFIFVLFSLATIPLADAQCTMPAPLSNGNTFRTLMGESYEIKMNNSNAGTFKIFNVTYPLVCDGNMGTDYYGRVTVPSIGQDVGFCFSIRSGASGTLFGAQWRVNNSFVAPLVAQAHLYYPSGGVTTVNYTAFCNSGGFRPELEQAWVDMSSASYQGGTGACPAALQKSFHYYMNPGGSCNGSTADGLTNTSVLSINTNNCPPAAFFLGVSTLHCLYNFAANGINYVVFSDALTSSGTIFCMAYTVTSNTVVLSLQQKQCERGQTPTVLGNFATGNLFVFTFTPTSTGGTGSGSGSGSVASYVAPSIVLYAFLLLKHFLLR